MNGPMDLIGTALYKTIHLPSISQQIAIDFNLCICFFLLTGLGETGVDNQRCEEAFLKYTHSFERAKAWINPPHSDLLLST